MSSPVLLVTCTQFATGEPGAPALDAALAARGVPSRWVAWDDQEVDWASAALVAVRSPWDYVTRCEEFLTWARRVAGVAPMLNGPEAFAWNVDKSYLIELAGRVPVVPTRLAADRAAVATYVAEFGRAVVKPRVGVGGFGLSVVDSGSGGHPEGDGPWVVQPLVESVRTEGEHSVWVIDGRPVSQVTKLPGDGEVRVHGHFGGTTRPATLTPEAAELARAALSAAADLIGQPLDYGRVDLLRTADGALAVTEVEVTEPELYLESMPGNAAPFADLVRSRLGR